GRFEFGADVVLDATSESGAVGSTDNGDNLVQRGLFDDLSQYKLQLDARRPSCRVKGSVGAVFVTASMSVQPGRWYRVRCVRDGSTVSIAVTTWADDGTPTVVTRSATGPTGDMAPSRPTVPLSIGGKLSASGESVTSTDQLNGVVDNVVLRTD
ncbi:LamG domain-containing protein, partial [Iamia sp.]|uniref:LamG domain-containing protein n=1 Tax=Iamia sp. TaxID=2722710 RepID=UPI002CCC2D2A